MPNDYLHFSKLRSLPGVRYWDIFGLGIAHTAETQWLSASGSALGGGYFVCRGLTSWVDTGSFTWQFFRVLEDLKFQSWLLVPVSSREC